MSKFAVLRARLADRRALDKTRHGQRGAVLVEALIMAVVGAMAMGGYLAITMSTQNVVRHHAAVDVADQYVTGLAEKMRVLPWSSVGNCSTEATIAGSPTDATDNWTAQTYDAYVSACPTRFVKYYEEATIANVKMRVTSRVTWALGGAHTSGLPNPAQSGWKRVTFVVKYKPVGSPTERTRTLTMYRNSTPGEALSTTLPVDGAPL